MNYNDVFRKLSCFDFPKLVFGRFPHLQSFLNYYEDFPNSQMCLNLAGILRRIGMQLCLKAHKENSDLSLDNWALHIVNFGSPYLLTQPLDGAVILWQYSRGCHVLPVQISESSNHWNVHYCVSSDNSSLLAACKLFMFLGGMLLTILAFWNFYFINKLVVYY
jgi:WD40 repeat protein